MTENMMRSQNLLPYLNGKTLDEQRAFLQSIKFPETEIEDYLRMVNMPRAVYTPKPKTVSSVMDDPKYQRIFNSIAKLQAEADANPKRAEETQQAKFQRDILHNRYLLKAETDLDGASMHNPNFRETDIWKHLWHEFRPGHFRNLLLIGDTGNGKTFAAITYINTIAEVRIEVNRVQQSNALFVKPYRICEMLADQKRWFDELREIRRTRILMIDDLGTEPTGFKGADFVAFVDDMFDERSKRPNLITIFTSNGTVESVKDGNGNIKPGIRDLYGDRFASRFGGNGYYYESKGVDLRIHANG